MVDVKKSLYIVQGPDQRRELFLSVQNADGGLTASICMVRQWFRNPQVYDMEET
jgi:hypothetical protein